MTLKNHHSIGETGNKAEAFEASDNISVNPSMTPTLGAVISTRYGRRDVLKGLLAVSVAADLLGSSASPALAQGKGVFSSEPTFSFPELLSGNDETHHVADGYSSEVLLRWGDPLFSSTPEFDPYHQSAETQLQQFGYNNDYVGFVPLDAAGDRGLLCVNHEYTNEEMMFPGLGRQDRGDFVDMTRDMVDIEMAAHGGSVVEIVRDQQGRWRADRNSPYNRRITPLTTEMRLDGPAAGHTRLQTSVDPSGQMVMGTLNNCAGGMTPWGTWLMAEENFHGYFWSDTLGFDGEPDIENQAEARQMKRYGVPGRWYAWGRFHDRFNIDKEPNESNRFGWVVEVDPKNPRSTPVKHTALGRFSHEGAETIVSSSGKLVVYMGDDRRFEYLYKYVSAGAVSASLTDGGDLLSNGTLYVARFDADGSLTWLPLVHGDGPLTTDNGFHSQADVLIDARLAADLLGATPMDRPEDVQPHEDGKAYVMLTNNSRRKADEVDAANPRAKSRFGHIIEINEAQGDHASTHGSWSILIKCGDPAVAEVGARWNPETSKDGWFGSPDNCTIDPDGRLWVATDQGSNWHRTGKSDGLYAVETQGYRRGTSTLFFRCPVGAELCGPCFTPDGENLFLAVQHPGTDGTKHLEGFERASTFDDPATRWPDFDPNLPPRPSIVVVTRNGGGKIAS